jgi:hypothetical protein
LILATLKFDHSIKAKPKPYLAKRAKNAKEDSRKSGFGFLGVLGALGALGEKFKSRYRERGRATADGSTMVEPRRKCGVYDRDGDQLCLLSDAVDVGAFATCPSATFSRWTAFGYGR